MEALCPLRKVCDSSVFEFCRSARLKPLSATLAGVLAVFTIAGCAAGAHGTRLDNLQAQTAESTTASSSPTTPTSPFQPTTSATADPASFDFAALLLQAGDLSDTDDTFALRSSKEDPNGLHGASALFVNQDDTRAVSVTIANYPNSAVATSTLREAVATAGTVVTGGNPAPLEVGTDGTVIRGTAPDGAKSVTLALFTEGPMLARLEFDSATGDTTSDRFVTNVAKLQQIALRVGVPTDTQ